MKTNEYGMTFDEFYAAATHGMGGFPALRAGSFGWYRTYFDARLGKNWEYRRGKICKCTDCKANRKAFLRMKLAWIEGYDPTSIAACIERKLNGWIVPQTGHYAIN